MSGKEDEITNVEINNQKNKNLNSEIKNLTQRGKFGKSNIEISDSIGKVPEESKKHFESFTNKSIIFQETHAEILNINTKEELKENLPKAMIVKKNLKKDVDQLYISFKEYKKENRNKNEVNDFKDACNNVIKKAQRAHGEIKEKINSIYEKD